MNAEALEGGLFEKSNKATSDCQISRTATIVCRQNPSDYLIFHLRPILRSDVSSLPSFLMHNNGKQKHITMVNLLYNLLLNV